MVSHVQPVKQLPHFYHYIYISSGVILFRTHVLLALSYHPSIEINAAFLQNN